MTLRDTLRSLGGSAIRRKMGGSAANGIAAGAVAAAIGLVGTAAMADDLIVKFDQSEILRLSRPAAEIIVGNPSIADVTVQTGNILVITGKSFGITNLIVLDAERNVIQDQRISVRRDEAGIVNVHKGTLRQTYTCMPQCNPTITVGDDPTYMQQTLTSSQSKMKFSEGSSADTQSQAGN